MGSNQPLPPACELCAGQATLYCPSDSAFLCPSCDSRVHHANFLVSRHHRQPICPHCHSVSPCATCSLPFSGQGEARSASSSSSSSSSSACISTNRSPVCRKTDASSGPKRTPKGADEVLFATWCKRMGLERHAGSIVPGATRVLKVCRGRLPMRVAAAASFTWGMRREEGVALTWERVKRVEEVTGGAGEPHPGRGGQAEEDGWGGGRRRTVDGPEGRMGRVRSKQLIAIH